MNNRLKSTSRTPILQGSVKACINATLISLILMGCSDSDDSYPIVHSPKPPQSDGIDLNIKDSGQQQLSYQFTRTPPPVPSPPGTQQVNQELPGRAFQLKVLRKLNDANQFEDVTLQVNWRSTDETCQLESCYVISDGKIIGKQENKSIVLVAELDGLETSEIEFETLTSLKECNTEQPQSDSECLQVVKGVSGAAANKLFTEPPRIEVIHFLGYKVDRSYFNTGYTYSGFTFERPSQNMAGATMMNSGYDVDFQSDGTVGVEGQYARYCRDLSAMEFNGRNNWRRATKEELVDLSNQGVVTVNGWPNAAYSTSTVTSDYSRELASVIMLDGFVIGINEGEARSPTCVSSNPK